jgi:4-hydroxybenzoate polyprenyltransferase
VLVLVAAHFAWQVSRLDLNDPKDCLAKFKSNQTVGLMIFAAIVLGRVVG